MSPISGNVPDGDGKLGALAESCVAICAFTTRIAASSVAVLAAAAPAAAAATDAASRSATAAVVVLVAWLVLARTPATAIAHRVLSPLIHGSLGTALYMGEFRSLL